MQDSQLEKVSDPLQQYTKLKTDLINVAAILHNDGINGPGLRTVVFVQGCDRKCKGCHSYHTWEFGTGRDFTADDLFEALIFNPLDDGITITGGDPLYQFKQLLPVVTRIKKETTKNLLLYTGATEEELMEDSKDADFKSFILSFDNIVSEPFIIEQRDLNLMFRGSKNQKVLEPYDDGDTVRFENISKIWDTSIRYAYSNF